MTPPWQLGALRQMSFTHGHGGAVAELGLVLGVLRGPAAPAMSCSLVKQNGN